MGVPLVTGSGRSAYPALPTGQEPSFGTPIAGDPARGPRELGCGRRGAKSQRFPLEGCPIADAPQSITLYASVNS